MARGTAILHFELLVLEMMETNFVELNWSEFKKYSLAEFVEKAQFSCFLRQQIPVLLNFVMPNESRILLGKGGGHEIHHLKNP